MNSQPRLVDHHNPPDYSKHLNSEEYFARPLKYGQDHERVLSHMDPPPLLYKPAISDAVNSLPFDFQTSPSFNHETNVEMNFPGSQFRTNHESISSDDNFLSNVQEDNSRRKFRTIVKSNPFEDNLHADYKPNPSNDHLRANYKSNIPNHRHRTNYQPNLPDDSLSKNDERKIVDGKMSKTHSLVTDENWAHNHTAYTHSPHVYIDLPHPVFGARPFTQQSGPCGARGDFMSVPAEWLSSKSASKNGVLLVSLAL